MKEGNVILEKTFQFSLDVIKLYVLHKENKEYVLAKQFLRSGTAIGALAEEAQGAHSRKDFIAKLEIAYKEARETRYWFRLLNKSQLIQYEYDAYIQKADEIMRILSSIIKSSKD
jgi:four helix bundle protein